MTQAAKRGTAIFVGVILLGLTLEVSRGALDWPWWARAIVAGVAAGAIAFVAAKVYPDRPSAR